MAYRVRIIAVHADPAPPASANVAFEIYDDAETRPEELPVEAEWQPAALAAHTITVEAPATRAQIKAEIVEWAKDWRARTTAAEETAATVQLGDLGLIPEPE